MTVGIAAVREVIALNAAGTSSYSDETIGSNIRAARAMLERVTNRWFVDRTATLRFTTNGQPYVTIPGLRTASSVTQVGSTLTVDDGYHLVPDVQQTGVYTGLQLRGFRTTNGPWWKSSPEWFDRNLDSPWHPANRGWGHSSIPNDLVIAGQWGYAAGTEPEEYLLAEKTLAAWLTLRGHALLTGVYATPDGTGFDMSAWPTEVAAFVKSWQVGQWAASV